jgi:carbon-monoxide dehydrogenase medium subunit
MYPFEYQKPADVKAAVQAVSGTGENKYIAGGMTLLPTLKLRLARPDRLVDLRWPRGARRHPRRT